MYFMPTPFFSNSHRMNYYLLIYVLFCIGIGFGGLMFFIRSSQYIGAVSFLVGAVLIFVFFGLRWFQNANNAPWQTKSWPPVINTCPDYLMYYERPMRGVDGNTTIQPTCVDPLGISTNPAKLMKWPGSAPSADKEEYYFKLDFAAKDPVKLLAEKCERALEYGVTWEGICDGDSCAKYRPPVEPGAGGGTGGGACPTA
jgi:hypothetical protein